MVRFCVVLDGGVVTAHAKLVLLQSHHLKKEGVGGNIFTSTYLLDFVTYGKLEDPGPVFARDMYSQTCGVFAIKN